MLDFSHAVLDSVIVLPALPSQGSASGHIAAAPLDLSDEMLAQLLQSYFLSSFRGSDFYSFGPEGPLDSHPLFPCCSAIFDGGDMQAHAQAMAQHLHSASQSQTIKDGELFVAFVRDCVVDGEMTNAIGLFKAESKDQFLKVHRHPDGTISVSCEFGISPKRLDKGCLVFDTERELGLKLCVVDNTNRDQARFWADDFLQATRRDSDFYQTKTAMSLYKDFVQDVITPTNDHSKIEQAQLLSKARDYFTNRETFEQDDFEATVLQSDGNIEAFREYKREYEDALGYEIPQGFAISTDAAKQASKTFKSCIKLDKNFHIYIHGKQERVEKGYDHERGLNYYKLFFDHEQ